jgi:RimJ/RimL family protein N-acetyltransferase
VRKIKPFNKFLVGHKVDLIILDKNVVKNTDWYTWLNDQRNTKFMATGKFPNTIEKQLKYLETEIISEKKLLSISNMKSGETFTDKRIQLGIVVKKTNMLVGMISVSNFRHFSRTCVISLIMDLKKNVKNRLKIFKESQDLMIEHIFFRMNFRKIYAGVISEKLSVLSEKLWGFKREGVFKKHQFVNGKYLDAYMLGLFREDWEKKIKIASKNSKL